MNVKHRARALLLIPVIAAVLCASWTVSASATLVEPARFILQIGPGQNDGGAITITNSSSKSARYLAIVQDWVHDVNGVLTPQPANSTSASIANWVKFNPREFTLPPNGRQIVRFSISVPKNAPPGERRGVIFFSPTAQSTGLSTRAQIGVVIYAAIEPVTRTFGVGLPKATLNSARQAAITIELAATGNAHCRLTGKFRLSALSGKLIEEGRITEKVILPGGKRTITVSGDKELTPGRYRLHLEIGSYGTTNVFRRDYEIELQG